jgi:hypothetical protein
MAAPGVVDPVPGMSSTAYAACVTWEWGDNVRRAMAI